MTVSFYFLLLLLLLAWLTPTLAGSNALTGDERIVPSAYQKIADEHDIPYKIFYANVLTESGYVSPSNGLFRPWPWTLNIAGTSKRFLNKAAALEFLRNKLLRGHKNVDIGFAQVNHKWNGDFFPSLSEALDPHANLQVSARILKRELLHCKSSDWWCAVGRYHSPGQSTRQKRNAEKHVTRAKQFWTQLQ